MSRVPFTASCKRQKGLSLIELMVSIAIGLVVIVAVMSAYLGTADAGKMADAQSRMNEDANAALTILSQQLRMAGTNPKRANYMNTTASNPVFTGTAYSVRGCDGSFGNIASPLDPAALTCAGTASTSADSVAVTYEADEYNTVPISGAPTAGKGRGTDCLGSSLSIVTSTIDVWNGAASVPTAVTYTVANNLFYIKTTSTITAPSLYCLGNGNAGDQPLVENVEDMQLTYGTARVGVTSTDVAGYLLAQEITSNITLATLPADVDRWAKVVAVRVCVVVRSEKQVAPTAASAQYIKCDGTLNNAPPDLRLRRAYYTTVVLRNRLSF